MKLIAIPSGPIETNAWLFVNEDKGEALLFDAPPQSYDLIMEEIKRQKCILQGLIITHGHWDHMLDAHLFAADGIAVYAHAEGSAYLENPEFMSSYAMPGLVWKGCGISNSVVDGEKLNLAGTELEVRFSPGHCPGSIIVYIDDIKAAVTGDVIFRGSIGRTDLPGGSFEMLSRNIQAKIYSLPDDVTLCPGHGPETTVEFEKSNNPFVREEA